MIFDHDSYRLKRSQLLVERYYSLFAKFFSLNNRGNSEYGTPAIGHNCMQVSVTLIYRQLQITLVLHWNTNKDGKWGQYWQKLNMHQTP